MREELKDFLPVPIIVFDGEIYRRNYNVMFRIKFHTI